MSEQRRLRVLLITNCHKCVHSDVASGDSLICNKGPVMRYLGGWQETKDVLPPEWCELLTLKDLLSDEETP